MYEILTDLSNNSLKNYIGVSFECEYTCDHRKEPTLSSIYECSIEMSYSPFFIQKLTEAKEDGFIKCSSLLRIFMEYSLSNRGFIGARDPTQCRHCVLDNLKTLNVTVTSSHWGDVIYIHLPRDYAGESFGDIDFNSNNNVYHFGQSTNYKVTGFAVGGNQDHHNCFFTTHDGACFFYDDLQNSGYCVGIKSFSRQQKDVEYLILVKTSEKPDIFVEHTSQ